MATGIHHESGAKKYQELEAHWRQRIREGAWQPGERLPTFADLCDRHSVSRTTVERVCRSLERDGLIVRRQGSGTYIAHGKPAVATGFIGFSGHVFRAGPLDGYWSVLQNGVREAARSARKGVVLFDDETFDGWDKVDGLLMSDATPASVHTQRLLRSLPTRLPRVSMLFAVPGTTSVIADDYQGGVLAVEHLLRLGHRKIACLMDRHHLLVRQRYDGYRDALRRAGIEPDARWARPYSEPGERAPHFFVRGAEVMQAWLEQDWGELGCTALLVQNDMIATGAMTALQQAGLSVPRQVSIVGFDNIDICDCVSPRLTSIEVPLHRMGAVATEMLCRQISADYRVADCTTVLPVQLHVRDSTAIAPAGA